MLLKNHETLICIFTEFFPDFAVITAVPVPFAVTLPVEETVATEVLLLVHVTLPSTAITAPSWSVPPFLRFRERQLILPSLLLPSG